MIAPRPSPGLRFVLRQSLWLVWLLTAAGALVAASVDDLEFDGVLVAGGRTQVALLDRATGAAKWVPEGGKFEGFAVGAYDPAKDTVSLTRDGAPPRSISLKVAFILVTPPASSWLQPTNAERAAVAANLQQLAAAAAQYLADTGMPATSLDELVGPGKLLAQLDPVAGENYRTINLAGGAADLGVTLPDGTHIAADGISIAADGSRILADGGRVTTNGTRLAPDGTVISTNPNLTGPFIPANVTQLTASALEAAGWKYRPSLPVSLPQ
jgi:hypothetical protein